jgi:hypothetical protein
MRKHMMILVIVSMLLIAGQIPAALAQDATPSDSDMAQRIEQVRAGEVCAWPIGVAVDALNVAYPDTNATYYAFPYMLGEDEALVLEGAYPFARFFSLTTYYGVGVPGGAIELLGWLRDTRIVPDDGSVNPAVDEDAPEVLERRQWTVRITGTAPVGDEATTGTPLAAGETGENVIPANPEGAGEQLGLLVIRIYVPAEAEDPTGGVGRPTMTLEAADGSSRTVPECMAEEAVTWTDFLGPLIVMAASSAPPLPVPPDATTPPEWIASRVPGLGPNPDNRYLMAPIAWQEGRIVVARGQAPTFPDTRAGDSPAMPADLRYWSFCTGSNVLEEPDVAFPTTDCVPDFVIPIDEEGFYTVVVSQPEDQPANATVENGIAWVQGADPALPDLLLLRHMLPSDAFFDQSVWAVPERTPDVAQEILGPYFPQTVYCDVSTFEEGGAEACFAAGEEVTPTG